MFRSWALAAWLLACCQPDEVAADDTSRPQRHGSDASTHEPKSALPSSQASSHPASEPALPAASAGHAATSPSGSARSPQSAGCRLPTPRPPRREAVGGAAAEVADWMDGAGRCVAPKEFQPWSWSTLRRVHGLREKVIVITVDGGHDLPVTHQGLDVLRDYGVRATYFLTTSVLARTAGGKDLVQRIATEGHELANHSVSHPNLTKLSDDDARAEIQGADAWIAEAVGYSPRPFFRAPFLDRDERIDRITKKLCYRPVWFTIHTRDDEANIKADDIARAVLCDEHRARKIESGSILMFHASQKETVTAWPVIITGLEQRGFRFMTLGEALQARARHRQASGRRRP